MVLTQKKVPTCTTHKIWLQWGLHGAIYAVNWWLLLTSVLSSLMLLPMFNPSKS